MGIESKNDHSPIVTVVDRAVELMAREMIEARWPEHGIVGEEFPSVRPEATYLWVIDPIDGTIAFSMGRPTFGTLIALFEDDTPVLGIIDQAILEERWIGVSGEPTLFNGVPTLRQPAVSIATASLAINGVEHLRRSEADWKRIIPLRDAFHVFCYGGDCYNFGLLANGYIDAVVEASPDLCDIAALIPIVEGAGGNITDWDGKMLTRHNCSGVLATSARWIHDEALALLRHERP